MTESLIIKETGNLIIKEGGELIIKETSYNLPIIITAVGGFILLLIFFTALSRLRVYGGVDDEE